MLTSYGIHPAHDAAIAAHDLLRAVRNLRDDETYPDRVGLALAADTLAAVTDALDRHWWALRPAIDRMCEEVARTERMT